MSKRAMLGAALAVLLTFASGVPGAAAAEYPRPRTEEWWFTSWEIQQRIWPVSEGQGVIVAVLDTGVQADLPELSGVVLPGSDIAGGGDGRTDTDDAAVPGHGTAMASLIASQGGPTGFLGMAPKAKILPVTVHSTASAIAPGIRYAVDHGAKVINISQTVDTPCPDSMQTAVGYALDHDVVVVAGAGNTGNKANPSEAPANCAGVLAAGAIGVSGQSFVPLGLTQRQPYVAVAAPGGGVGGVLRDGQYHNGQGEGGTSPASALTSASAAIIRAKYPKMSAREVVQRLISSCLDVGPAGRDDATGYGLIRPTRALSGDLPKNVPNPVFAAYDKWKRSADPSASRTSSPNASPSGGGSSGGPFVLLIGLIVLVLAAALIVILMTRGRRRRMAAGPPVGPPTGPYGGDFRQGPPPSFGPGPHGHGPPPQGSGRPTFEPPPQGPPDQRR